MKKIIMFFFAIVVSIAVNAQIPEQFNYQAVLRDANGNIISNQEKVVKIEILQGSTTGTVVFTEIHNATTTSQGIINLVIGSIESLNGIEWGSDTFFLKLSLDGIEMGTTQLLSVPYSFHAKTADSICGEIRENDPIFNSWDKSSGISITESQVNDLKNYLTEEMDPSLTQNFDFTEAAAGDILQFNGTKWVKLTPDYLTSYTETDPEFTEWDKSSGISINESQVSDLKQYLTNEVDPFLTLNFNFSNALSGDLLKYNGTKWVKFTPNYLTSFIETDPEYTSWNKDYEDLINKPTIATSSVDGLMSHLDKSKLDGVGYGAEMNVNANWFSTSGDSKILNKPTMISQFSMNANSQNIFNLSDPVSNQDAATKSYVDNKFTAMEDILINAGLYTVKDADGNSYNVVRIGSQLWMKENLKTTRYANGEIIGTTDPLNLDISLESTPKYQWPANGNESYVSTYGRLYTWFALEDPRGVCPAGWHLPTDDEWKTLEMELGMSQEQADAINFRGTDEGSKLAGSAALWTDGALDQNSAFGITGFSVIPVYYRSSWGTFLISSEKEYIWTISSDSELPNRGIYRQFYFANSGIFRNIMSKDSGMSVRCLKD